MTLMQAIERGLEAKTVTKRDGPIPVRDLLHQVNPVPRGSVRSAPPRRPGSVRRTVTMDFTWPDGLAGNTVLDGRARDLRTDGDGVPTVLGQAWRSSRCAR